MEYFQNVLETVSPENRDKIENFILKFGAAPINMGGYYVVHNFHKEAQDALNEIFNQTYEGAPDHVKSFFIVKGLINPQ